MATAAARDRGYEADYAMDDAGERASGWVAFAAVMLGFAGTWNIIDGSLAVARSKVYAVNATYVFGDLRTWGWIILAFGIAQVCAAFALLGGSSIARWFGIAAAAVSSIAQLMFIPAAPFWALAMFALDMLVIYALTVYGGRRESAV
jgi:hypothetical protein